MAAMVARKKAPPGDTGAPTPAPPRQNSFQLAEDEDTSTLKLKHLSEAIAMLTNPRVSCETITNISVVVQLPTKVHRYIVKSA